MKIGDLVKWESVKNDMQEELDVNYGVVIELRLFKHQRDKSTQVVNKALVQFHDESVWLPVKSITSINEQ
jgi:hypothetical protein